MRFDIDGDELPWAKDAEIVVDDDGLVVWKTRLGQVRTSHISNCVIEWKKIKATKEIYPDITAQPLPDHDASHYD